MADINAIDLVIKYLKEHRNKQNLTLEQVADLSGIHRTTIGLIERREREPSLQILFKISQALNVSLGNLITLAETEVGLRVTNADTLGSTRSGRLPETRHLRNQDTLFAITGLDSSQLQSAIERCYATLDSIDTMMAEQGSQPLAHTVELANLSSMIGNLLGAGIEASSQGLYKRNRPHAFPDLLPQSALAKDLEIKVALETNKPKGHLPKSGIYIIFRYVLANKDGVFKKGKENRGNTAWIWEIKIGKIGEFDFLLSNTEGDSGKTAVIKTDVFNAMPLIYFVPELCPYSVSKSGGYVGFN